MIQLIFIMVADWVPLKFFFFRTFLTWAISSPGAKVATSVEKVEIDFVLREIREGKRRMRLNIDTHFTLCLIYSSWLLLRKSKMRDEFLFLSLLFLYIPQSLLIYVFEMRFWKFCSTPALIFFFWIP